MYKTHTVNSMKQYLVVKKYKLHFVTSTRPLTVLDRGLLHKLIRMVLNQVESDWANVFADVPQGPIIDPFRFLIYINDEVNNILSSKCLCC